MYRSISVLMSSLIVCAVSTIANANIVLSGVLTSPVGSTNVGVDLYAFWDGSGGNQVGTYRIGATIIGTVASSITASHNFNPTSAWNPNTGIALPLTLPGSPDVSLMNQEVIFRAANTNPTPNSIIPNVTVGTTANATTLLGSINFTGTSPYFQMIFTALPNQDYPSISGFGFVPNNSTGQQVQLGFSPQTLAVVPEPGAFALCGLAGMIGVWRARRKKQ